MKNLKSIIALFVLTVFSVNAWGAWTRVTTVKELTDGGTFIMGYEATAKSGVIVPLRSADCGATITTNGYFYSGTTENSSTGGTINMSTVTTTTDYEVYITSPASGKINIQMKNAEGNFYGASSGGSSKNTGRLYTSGNSSETNLTLEFSNESNNQFKLTAGVDGQYKYLKFNTDANYPRYACYKSAGSQIVFYKKEADCAAPTATSNGATTKTSQVVNWTDATGSAWDIYYSTSSTTPTTQTIATGLTEKTYTFSGLTPNTKYYWWVRTNCGSGSTSAWKAGSAFTTNPITFTDYITECSSDPSISVSTTELNGFTYIYSQGPSTAKMVTVYGSYLDNGVTVTASDNYEICLSQDGTYTNTINLTPTDQMVNALVYVRLKAGKEVNSYDGTLTVASTGLDSKTVSLAGSVTRAQLATPSVIATPGVHQITLSWAAVDNADSYQLSWNGGAAETVTSPIVKDNLTGGQSYSYSLVAVGSGNYTNSAAAASSAIAGKDTYTVKFVNNGSELTEFEKQVEEGAMLGELPTLTEPCDPHSTTFAGWTTDEAWTEPKTTFTNFVTPTTTVNAAMTLNAVWAEETVVPSTTYSIITSESKLTEGNYVIAYKYDTQSQFVLKNEKNGSSTTQLAGYVWAPTSDHYSNPDEAYIWKITSQGDGSYSIYNAAVEQYVNATSAASGDGTVVLSETPSYFDMTYDNSGSRWVVALKDGGDYCFHGYSSNPSYYFKVSTSPKTSGTTYKYRTHLYKQGTTIGRKNYITTCSTDPLIEVSATELSGFSTIATTGNPSAAQSFTVEGYNLTEDITISVSSGYEMCQTEDGTYSSEDIILPLNGGKVYVRLAAAETAADNVSGNISITSAGATTKNVALTGEVIAAVTVTFKNNDSTTDAPAAIKLGKGGTLGSNLPGVGTMTAPITGYTFVGWVNHNDVWTGFESTLTQTLITGNEPINADVTYDAVWAKGGNDFEIMGNSDPFTDGNYIITYSLYSGLQAMGNVVSGSNITTIEVDDQDEGIISNNTEAKVVWTLHKTGTNTVTFYNADKGQYLQGTSSALSFTNTPVDWTWSMTPGEEGYPKYKFSIGTNGLYYWSNEFQYHSSPDPLYIYKQQLNNFFVTTPNKYTVTWHKGNAGTATSSAFEGQTFADIVADAPSVDDEAAGDCANKFMGWATEAIEGTDADGSSVQWAKDNTTPISGDVDYYAVFAYQEGSATSYTLTIGTSDVPTSYDVTSKTLTAIDDADASNTMDVILQFKGVMLNQTSEIQVRKSGKGGGYIYNTTNLGSVTSISAGNLNTYYGNSEHPTSGSTTGTPYFTIGNTSETETLDEIVIKYTIGSATYSNYVTQCTPIYDVKFYTDNGTTQYGETQSIEENGYATAPATEPENDCSDFKGWSKTWGGNAVNVGEVQITEPTNFYAVWDAIKPVLDETYPKDNVATQGFDAADLKVIVSDPTAGTCLTYQWQKSTNATTDFEDILGATASTYTPSTVEANTTYYRCVVTNGNKSTTSRVATFSVSPVTKCFAPSISIATGKAGFIRSTLVTLTTETEGATIYYTTDGTTTPSAETSKYTAPFTITDNTTIKAIAIKTEMTNSDVATATFYKATLQEIAVKDAPENTEYTALETFNPAGLVITASYDYELSEDIEYNEASKNDFSFNPALTTPLNVGDNEITIIYGGKEATQEITVNCIAIDAPAPSQPEAKQFTEVTIEWAVDEHADHYELSWKGGAAEIVTSPYKKEGLTHSTTYHYTLTAVGKTNYCNATAENQEAKTKNRMLTGIDDTKPIICTHGNYFAGQTIKNSDFTVTLLYNNGDTEQGNPNYVGLSEPVTTKETDALTEDQEGQLTVYLKSGTRTVSTTVTVANPSVTFNVPSGTEAPTAIHRGDNYPSMPNITDCGDNEYDYTFVGWVENTVDEETTTEPENIITAGTTCEITTDQVVYALYKRTFNDEENATWTLISSKANIVSGETYLLLTNNKEMAYAGEVNDSKHFVTAAINYSSNPPSISDACQVILTSVGTDIYTIKDCNNKYLTASDAKSGSAKLSDSDASGWKFTNPTSGMNAQYQATDKKAYLRSYENTTFRTYAASSNGDAIYLAKKVPTINTYYITTPNCAKRVPVSLDLDITNVQREFYVNDAFNFNNLVVTAHFDNEDVEDVSASEFTSVTAPDMTTATEEATVKVSYIENETTVSKTYTVLIKERVTSVVTLVSAGRESTLEGQHYTGEQVNLPTEPSLTVKGYEFMGWSTEEIETPSSCPATGFYAGGASFNLTQPAYTFYAVYALGAGSASDNDKFGLSIVTDPAGLVDGGMYMFTIANTSNTLAATTVSNSVIQTVTDFKTEQLQGNESYIWKLSASDDNTFKMQMSDAKYLSNTNSTSVSAQTNATEAASWTLSYGTNSESGWRIQNATHADHRFLGLTGESGTTIKAYSPSPASNWDTYPHVFTIYRLMGGYTTAPTLVVDGTDVTEIPEDFNGHVIVEDVGDVTLNTATTWKNLTIKNGAKVSTYAALTIKDLLIETKMGAGTGKKTSPNIPASCGQLIIKEGGSVTANGTAIVENQIDPTGVASYGWYTFSVPFPVDALNGIYDTKGNKLTNEYDYAIMDYHGDIRAQGQYGWKKYRGILQPGVMYAITVADTDFGTLRFKKTADGDVMASNSIQTKLYGDAESEETKGDANWNGLGNPNLYTSMFSAMNITILQFYDHDNNIFAPIEKQNVYVVVGSSFFIQTVKRATTEDGAVVTMEPEGTSSRGYRAPAREVEKEEPFIAVQLLQGEAMNDQVFINASDEATATYEIGRDVAKAFMSGEVKCAQLYVPAYGTKLCAADFQLNSDDEAMFPLTITAPKAGTYTLALDNAQKNATVYLMQNGAIIWNLSQGAYEMDLAKGTNNEYTLVMKVDKSDVITGSDVINTQADGIQKFIYDEKLILIHNGNVYNGAGARMK